MSHCNVPAALLGIAALPVVMAAQNPPAQQPAPGAQPQAAAAPVPAPLPPNGWRIDAAHSAIAFRVRHLGMEWVNGQFQRFTGEFTYDPVHPESASVTVHIQAPSVTTQNDRRDNDLRANYLQADSFPEITFASRRVERVDSTHLRVAGDLTLHGVTRPVTLETELLGMMNGQRGKRIAFTATTRIKRQDFGLTRNALLEGAQLVGDDIYITIDLTANQPVSAPAGSR